MTPQEFAALPPEAQATLRAGLLMQNLLADNEAARQILPMVDKAAKKLNPSYITTEEQAAPIVDRVVKQIDEKLSARDKKAEEEAAVSRLNKQIEDAKSSDGFTDEGIQNVLKLMQEKGIGDFESAKKVYRFDNPAPSQAAPTSSTQMNWNAYETMQSGDNKNFFFPEGVPSITDSPEKWEREMALKYLDGQVSLPTS